MDLVMVVHRQNILPDRLAALEAKGFNVRRPLVAGVHGSILLMPMIQCRSAAASS